MSFLQSLYASTRADELKAVPWTDVQKQQFLQMQFRAQHEHYQQHYKGARFDVVSVNGIDVGRLYVHRQPNDIRIVDIAFLPAYMRQGYGKQLLQTLMTEAKSACTQLSIHVEDSNPAKHFYQHLGFQDQGENPVFGMYRHMVWRPS